MKTIRELRRERGWTQFELALAVGVQPQTIYLWESGRRQPQVPQMRKLGEVFRLCSDEIDLETAADGIRGGPHHPRAGRRPGEPAPGRNRTGRVAVRGADEGASIATADGSQDPRRLRSRGGHTPLTTRDGSSTPMNRERALPMNELDVTKRDMTVIYGERTFALRTYRQNGAWRGVIIENRTPIHSWIEPTADSATYFGAAVAFIAASVDAAVDATGDLG